ncbi:MAG TPA: Mut7-C RNAse domain-containing protein [Pyrinomonadaceae bacterium]|jgi:uncharacterized protein with PIN domain
MAVICAQCGRQYDATLFRFGRTISCACGARVGFEHRLNLPEAAEASFFADVNVARLVRWLRAVGLDTVWEDAIGDADLVRRAILERRFVLTLDKRLLREFRADNLILLSTDEPLAQFAEVVRRFNMQKPPEFFTRCLVCNAPLREAQEREIAEKAPEAVIKANEIFRFCPNCGKIYWEGTHTRRMRAAIERVFDALEANATPMNAD